VTRNFRLTIEFDGAAYAGWQFQPGHPTVQGEVEAAIRKTTGKEATVYGCGRTDAGVSARAYVANFHSGTLLTPERLRLALNHFLPDDVLILSVEEAKPGFHARHSARGKTYLYSIVRRKSPLRRRQAWQFWFPLDVEKMRRAAPLFQGRRDFRAFCQLGRKQELSRSASSALLRGTVPAFADGVCTVRKVRVTTSGDEAVVTVAGDRFLYKMVRRIVGALVACGSGRLTQKDIRAALAGRPYPPFQTAPAQGLCLRSVRY
jgi:tRNA pseudouridine38-40 synthase